MNAKPTRRRLLQAAACSPFAGWLPGVQACEFFAANLRVLHPWTRATRPGETEAVLNLQFDEVSSADVLVGVRTPVAAGAELVHVRPAAALLGRHASGKPNPAPAQTLFQAADPALPWRLAIPANTVTVLSDGGTHVRLVGLAHPLELGRSYPLKLFLANAGVVDASLSVDFGTFRFQ